MIEQEDANSIINSSSKGGRKSYSQLKISCSSVSKDSSSSADLSQSNSVDKPLSSSNKPPSNKNESSNTLKRPRSAKKASLLLDIDQSKKTIGFKKLSSKTQVSSYYQKQQEYSKQNKKLPNKLDVSEIVISNNGNLSFQLNKLPSEMQDRLISFTYLQKLAQALTQNHALENLLLLVMPKQKSVEGSSFESAKDNKTSSTPEKHQDHLCYQQFSYAMPRQ